MVEPTTDPWPQLNRLLEQQRQEFEQQAEEWLQDFTNRAGHLFCTRGCANCCTLAVHTTLVEARQISDRLSADQTGQLHTYIDRLRQQLGDLRDLKSYLRHHRQTLGPCPFLASDGACGIYGVRPFACRGLLSTRPADWCGVDFGKLDSWDRQLFEAGLDPAVVAWPSHYVAFTQELARHGEETVAKATLTGCGLSLVGNLPVLVWLLKTQALADCLADGPEAVRRRLTASGLNHPLLITLTGKNLRSDTAAVI